MSNEAMLLTALAAMATAVVTLFGLFRGQFSRLEKRADDCDADRKALWQRLLELEMFSCADRNCTVRQTIKLPRSPDGTIPGGKRGA